MELIIGGAYQGKLEYAKKTYQITEQDIYTCKQDESTTALDFSQKVIYKLEEFTLACVKQGIEAREYLQANRQLLEDKLIICMDISQGVVPMERDLRVWREMNGRALIYLSGEAEHVIRVFCGLPHIIK